MGLRLNKVLGYGINNAADHLVHNYKDRIDIFQNNTTYGHIKEWIKSSDNKYGEDASDVYFYWDIAGKATQRYFDFYNWVSYPCENNSLNTLVFTTSDKEWRRYDNSMDYIEYYKQFGRTTVDDLNIITLNSNIYPFKKMINLNTQQLVSPTDISTMLSWFNTQSYVLGLKSKGTTKDILAKHGIASYRDFKRNIKPLLPNIHRYIINFSGIFKDPQRTLLELNPMIHTYWD